MPNPTIKRNCLVRHEKGHPIVGMAFLHTCYLTVQSYNPIDAKIMKIKQAMNGIAICVTKISK